MTDFKITTNSTDETIKTGEKLGRQLNGGEVLAVCGELGSGKTHFIKGVVEGLGAEGGEKLVSSPTFVLVKEYYGRVDVYHIDAYRLGSAAEFEDVGFSDYCYSEAVVIIEWADKVKSALAGIDCIWINLSHVSEMQRLIRIQGLPAYITL